MRWEFVLYLVMMHVHKLITVMQDGLVAVLSTVVSLITKLSFVI